MIEVFLNEAVCDFVKEIVKNFRLEKPPRVLERKPGSLYDESDPNTHSDPDGVTPITVYNGWLPLKESDVDSFPFVTVRAVSGSVVSGRSDTVVEIMVGTFSRDAQAYRDCVNVMHRIMEQLTLLKNNILQKKYIRQDEMTWEMPFDQKEPYFAGVITTHWQMYSTESDFEV